MAKEKTISVIDVGSSKISSVTATISENRINVIGVSGPSESRGVNKGTIINIDEAVKAIDRSIQKTDKMSGQSIESVYLTINGSHIESQTSKGQAAIINDQNEIRRSDVERTLETARAVSLPSTREIIHVIPKDFKVDGNDGIHDPVGMYGNRLEVDTTIVHVSSMVAKNLKKCLSTMSIHVEELVYTGIAAGESVLTDSEKEMGVALIDIGATTTSLVVYNDRGASYCTTVAIGGKHITNDIAIHLRCATETAEKIKIRLSQERVVPASTFESSRFNETLNPVEFGLDTDHISKRSLFKIIDDRVEEILNLVLIELKKTNLLNTIPAGIVITGGAAKTAGMERMAKAILKLPVKIGYPKGVDGMVEEISDPEYAATVGLLIYAAKKIQSQSDLSSYKINDNLNTIINKIKKWIS
jgi:cell division protein FtsA